MLRARHRSRETNLMWIVFAIIAILLLMDCGTIDSVQRKRAEDTYSTLSLRYEVAKEGLTQYRKVGEVSDAEWTEIQRSAALVSQFAVDIRTSLRTWKEAGERPTSLDDSMRMLTNEVEMLESMLRSAGGVQ